jgi:hypothetical protein
VWHKKFYITYVDGEVIHLTSAEWPDVRADGVDRIDFGCVQRTGDSIYYLYPEKITDSGEMAWVCGSFAVYQNTCEESIMRINGECLMRTRKSVPDLLHSQVKLGWWRRVDGD